MIRRILFPLFSILLFSATAGSVRADGVTDILINPATGITISTPGSYRLAGDVTMTADAGAVVITAPNVMLDLNGHTITGFAGNTFDGISAFTVGVTVMNGAVIGFGESGVDLEIRAVVRGVRVSGCNVTGGSAALSVSFESVVENCVVSDNVASTGQCVGILTGNQSRIAGNIVGGNTSGNDVATGIAAGSNCTITDNVVVGTIGSSSASCGGITASLACIIRGNTVSGNSNTGTGNAIGISASTGSVIEHNTCTDQTASGTGSAKGIVTGVSLVSDNFCINNSAGAGSNGSGVGIEGGARSTIRNNHCKGNNGAGTGTASGIIVSIGCRVEGNQCDSNTGGAASHGIRVTNGSNLIAGNSTTGHTNAGIIFLSAANNRCHSNQCDETEVIESTPPGVAPASLGAGDLANVLY